MSRFQLSHQELRNGATNAGIIGQALGAHPVHHLVSGDVGHAGVAAALNQFRDVWAAELRLRQRGSVQAGRVLTAAATDVQRLDELLAQAASGMVSA